MSNVRPPSFLPTAFSRDPRKLYDRAKHDKYWESSSDDDSDSDDSDESGSYDTDDETDSSASSSTASSLAASSSAASSSAASSSASSSTSSSSSSASSSSASSSSSSSSAAQTSKASSSAAPPPSDVTAIAPAKGAELDVKGPRGIYRIDEEGEVGLMGTLKRWRLTMAAKRRHQGLVHFEEADVKAAEEMENAAISADKERIRSKREELQRQMRLQRRQEFLDKVRREDMSRYEREVAARARQSTQTRMVMGLLEEWGLEGDQRKAEQAARADEADALRRGEAAGAKRRARREGEEAGIEAARAEDEAATQEILAMMRRQGTIAGVNAPAAEAEAEQRETNKHVVLRCKKPEEVAGVRRDRKFSLFTVDLRKFKNVESMKGELVGVDGAVFLGEMLKVGCCARLVNLNLGWNRMKKVGCDRLFDALGKMGASCLVERLDLRMNHLPAASVRKLCKHLRGGALQRLEVLDLRMNMVGDEGATALAHAVLASALAPLLRLYVNSNQIGDIGVSALFKAFNAEQIFCPRIEVVNCRDNVVKAETVKTFDPCPIFFQA